jgi:NitT/TauT family transport system substrate-binding protein
MSSRRAVARVFVACVCLLGPLVASCSGPDHTPAAEAPHVRLGLSRENLSALAYVADEEGIFSDHGLDVELVEYSSSQIAYEAVVTGEVDAALCADTPIVLGALEGDLVTIIATVATDSNDIRVVARADAGISRPEDLEGKRIGTRQGTAAHFFLHNFLIVNGMSEGDVEVAFGSFEAVAHEVAAGQLDAAALRQPFISQLEEALGDEFVLFEQHGLYGKTMNLCVAPDTALADDTRAQLVRSFVDTERWLLTDTSTRAAEHVAASLDIDTDDLCDCMFSEGAVSLSQALVMTLEDQSRWAIGSGIVADPTPFDALTLIDTQYLDAVDPDRVSVIR